MRTTTSFGIRKWFDSHHRDATLLGICPMSREIIRAALREAKHERFPPMFIATPRQVDGDRGYTGWSQDDLETVIDSISAEVGYDGPYLVARDHGGPYQSFRDRGDEDIALENAMGYARELFEADQRAGFDLLHVDTTEDPSIEDTLSLTEIANRTVSLISTIESFEDINGASPLYEVGTEEIQGGMTNPKDFDRFLDLLRGRLGDMVDNAEHRLLFAVGQVGTTMRIDMQNNFEPDKAAALVDIASEHNVYLKTHFTDWLSADELTRFPNLGIGAANVGPEFAAALIEGLADLNEIERQSASISTGNQSEFMSILKQAAIDDAPWEKYAPNGLTGIERQEFISDHRRDIALCVGRYVLNEPDVNDARRHLYSNVRQSTDVEPNEYIVKRIQEAIHRYVANFNLSKTLDK